MIKRLFILLMSSIVFIASYAQDAPNMANATELSPNSAAVARSASDVNLFTGIPRVSIPLYSYSGKGMNFNISADYMGGGIKNGQYGSVIGIGWYLSAGGAVTRTVRGAPDDVATYGFMNAAAIPTDFRSSANKYYYDSIDAQQDIFQFNFNGRSGTFYIGKNKQIIAVPQSDLKIQYTTNAGLQIIAFKITDENGTKYLFNNAESTKQSITQGDTYYRSAYSGTQHYTAWYLSQIISPFNTDTIKLTYTVKSLTTDFSYPSVAFVKTSSDHSQTALFSPSGNNTSQIFKLTEVKFPDKTTVSFIYDFGHKYDETDYALGKIKISDTVFRKGYILDYQTSYTGPIYKPSLDPNQEDGIGYDTVTTTYATNLLLKSITPYTLKEYTKGYSFSYYIPYPNYKSYFKRDSVLNAFDYWGFFNGAGDNANPIPKINNVNNTGAYRSPNFNATENSLSYVYYPQGGSTHYEYELNSTTPSSIEPHQLTVNNATVSSQNNASLSQLFSSQHQFTFSLPNTVSRTGSPPLSGTCNLVFNVKSTSGATLYATATISLYDLFYQGIKTCVVDVPNGTYRLETSLSGGGSITGSFPFTISWNNLIAGPYTISPAGGVRIARITRQTGSSGNIGTEVEEYKYVREDGKSSGFLGDIPEYHYPFRQTITSTGTSTDLYVVSSDPISSLNYAQGSPVGYSRVEVYKGTATKNLGKTVYEFTTLDDVNGNYFHAAFPYIPQDIKEWGLGLPKRVLVYDSAGNLERKQTNQYSFNTTAYTSTDFKGLKLGCVAAVYAQDPATYPSTARTNTFTGNVYYPSTGWAALTASTDSIYHNDGSVQGNSISYTYDSHYQVAKTTSSYDRAKNLYLETRIYYPYSYNFSSGSIKTLKDSNIVTPVIATEKWITGDANPRMIDAAITNYQTLTSKHIVPSGVYKFQSNKPISQSVIGVFAPTVLIRNATYLVQQASYSLFDDKGNNRQITNTITGINAATIFDYDKQLPVAKVSNAAHADVAYTSFESDGTGNWTIAVSARNKASSITGKQSYSLVSGNITRTGLSASLSYVITVWVKFGSGSMSVNGSATTNIASHQGWGLYTITVSGVTSVTIAGTGLIDELRLMPKDANMVTYTYEPNVGVTSTSDINSTIIYTEYDNLNRIKLLRNIDNNIVQKFDYSDSIFSITNTASQWVGTGKTCTRLTAGAEYDSIYTDMNLYSDTYADTMHIMKGYDYCMCNASPQYKIINGLCETGQRIVTIASRVVVVDETGSHREWHCTYHYKWSDNSISGNFMDIYPDSPTNPCNVAVE